MANISTVVIKGHTYYRVQSSPRGAANRKYKTFAKRCDAERFLSARDDMTKRDATGLLAARYSIEQLADIKRAVDLLPRGKTLVDAVRAISAYQSDTSIADALREFKRAKSAQGVSNAYYAPLKYRLDKFAATFTSFDAATPVAIRQWLLSRESRTGGHASPKTIALYRDALKMFFAFCLRRDYISHSPLDKIGREDLPNISTPSPQILSAEQSSEFLKMLSTRYRKHLKFYALAMFAGIRVDEVERLSEANINYAERQIAIPANISKTKRADVLECLEPNLWAWLDALKSEPIVRPENKVRARMSKYLSFKLPHNFARHSFATYHYSLYRDARRTCAITRHSEQMLKQHYLAGLVDRATAQAYFAITPTL